MSGAGIVFDFDGTIVDTEDPVYRSWAELWADHGHQLVLEEWQAIIGTAHAFDPWAELEARVGGPLDPTLAEARRARRDEILHANAPRPGVLSWLDQADALEVPVAVASSSSSGWIDGNLLRLGLLDRFAYLCCCDEDVPPKPDPTSYRVACAAIGADPARSVAVEDSPNGIAAARAAGLFVVAVPHPITAALDLSGAHRVVASLEDLSVADALEAAACRRRP